MRVQSINSNNYRNNYQNKKVGFEGKGDAYCAVEAFSCHRNPVCKGFVSAIRDEFTTLTEPFAEPGSMIQSIVDKSGHVVNLFLLSPKTVAEIGVYPETAEKVLAQVIQSPETQKVELEWHNACLTANRLAHPSEPLTIA